MKTTPILPSRSQTQGPNSRAAFTITELMVALAISSLVIIAVVYSHLFGLLLFNLTEAKLSASDGARSALNHIRDEVRAGKLLYVGNASASSFTNATDNSPQQGNALQIYPTGDTNSFIRYFLDTQAQELKRTTSSGGPVQIIASGITNPVVFDAEDYAGTVLTNAQNNRVIRMSLQFWQWAAPSAHAGAGPFYDYFQLQTRMTQRAIE